MHSLWIRDSDAFLLVFDLGSLASFHALEAIYDDIMRAKGAASAPIVLVATKCDALETRTVPRAVAVRLAQEWRAPYYETSAKLDVKVDDVFYDIARQLVARDAAPEAGCCRVS